MGMRSGGEVELHASEVSGSRAKASEAEKASDPTPPAPTRALHGPVSWASAQKMNESSESSSLVSSRLPPKTITRPPDDESQSESSETSVIPHSTFGGRGSTTDDIQVVPPATSNDVVPPDISDLDDDHIAQDRELAEAIAAIDAASVSTTARAPIGDAFVLTNGGESNNSKTRQPSAVKIAQLETLAAALAGTADTASELRRLLASSGAVGIASAARQDAVRKCVAFVNDILQSAHQDELPMTPDGQRDTALCGFPVRSYNEWGAVQVRVAGLPTPRPSPLLSDAANATTAGCHDLQRTPRADIVCVPRSSVRACPMCRSGFSSSRTPRSGASTLTTFPASTTTRARRSRTSAA